MDVELAKWIIGGMAGGYVGLALYIVKLHADIRALLKERLKRAEEKLALINVLEAAGRRDVPSGGDE